MGAKVMFSRMDLWNGLGCWNTMPMDRRNSKRFSVLVFDVVVAIDDLAVTRQPLISRFMRFKLRKNVDLPQPEGPISAVISSVWN